MSEQYPPEIEEFLSELRAMPGVATVDSGAVDLAEYPVETYSEPGLAGDLPHALLRRTDGGLNDEAWAYTEITLDATPSGWRTLEFLAWFVRDQSRGGENVQLRVLALPPMAPEPQLGRTLKVVIDHFAICPGDLQPMLDSIKGLARMLRISISMYGDLLEQPDSQG